MLISFLVLFAFGLASEPLLSREFLEKLRNEVDWEVDTYEDSIFKHWTLDEFKNTFCNNYEIPDDFIERDESEYESDSLPDNFDGRVKWPKCIHGILNQGRCGSCWAFGVVESVSDRFCIGGKDVILAPQDLVSCSKANQGCQGGSVGGAINYLINYGSVSETCFPYVSGKDGRVPACPSRCPGKGTFTKYFCKKGSMKSLYNINAMKEEIMNHGPVVTGFKHYADFNAYKGGIYDHKSGVFICGHIMKPLGWGIEKGVKYWIIANTYGTNWGEKGYVRVKMGCCGVDSGMYSCSPKI